MDAPFTIILTSRTVPQRGQTAEPVLHPHCRHVLISIHPTPYECVWISPT